MPYCEAHFMEQFVPKCPTCREPVTTGGVVACGRTWHSEHFTCRNPGGCSNAFGDEGFLEQHGEPYCTEHYYELFGERCAGCSKVLLGASLSAMNKKWRAFAPCAFCVVRPRRLPAPAPAPAPASRSVLLTHPSLPCCPASTPSRFSSPLPVYVTALRPQIRTASSA